ncbi:hypothetical protein OIU76_004939 [Salix suchowensis]|uniref:Uncharacterized protein n=1 Tax=Salix suchowensis TaxID=1278906 RepID=A0ABQ9AB83_9ROSI|nr:hypothetical protein OIU78_014800 [Salix suchowensis]KAJ6329712.1 hypothetical protein OIU77_011225 [Salix suchowensis]KAJ6343098.1 hypothetical protein OIU76_004939 [Salix suchowensis]
MGELKSKKNALRSSSTLGEMLAFSDAKKFVRSKEEVINKEQEPSGSTSCIPSHLIKEDSTPDFPRGRPRSKSVPVSSMVYDARLNVEVLKEVTKAKRMKSSLKGKFSSLFFSRNKKPSEDKSVTCQSRDESQPAILESPVPPTEKVGDDGAQCTNNRGCQKRLSPVLHGSASVTYLDLIKQGIVSDELVLPLSLLSPLFFSFVIHAAIVIIDQRYVYS